MSPALSKSLCRNLSLLILSAMVASCTESDSYNCVGTDWYLVSILLIMALMVGLFVGVYIADHWM